MNITRAFAVVCLVLFLNPFARAQSNDRVQQTWRGADVSTLWELLKHAGAKGARVDVLKFRPAGDSGVPKALADAIGGTPEERGALAQAFVQLKQGYEAEVVRQGNSNNLAAAMTFFIAANVMSYYQTEMLSDADVARLMESLQQAMARIPGFWANVWSREAQDARLARLHGWLFADELHGSEATRRCAGAGDNQTVCRLLDAPGSWCRSEELRLAGPRLVVDAPVRTTANAATGKMLSAWTTSSAQNGGHMRLRYIFNADGSYSFKSERNHTAQR